MAVVRDESHIPCSVKGCAKEGTKIERFPVAEGATDFAELRTAVLNLCSNHLSSLDDLTLISGRKLRYIESGRVITN